MKHAELLRGKRVRLYCGDGRTSRGGVDNAETGFRTANERMLAAGRAAGVDIALDVLPGGHGADVWYPAFARDLPGLVGALAH